MPAISDPTTIRQTYQGVQNKYVNIVPLEVFATANVNGTPTFPTAELTVDSASADWEDMVNQMLVRVTRAGALIWEGSVRKQADSATVIYIANINEGDSGAALLQATSIQDNDTVTVYKNLVPFSYFSRIDPDTLEFYKRYDIGWDTLDDPFDKATLEPAPVVNMGSHRHIRIAPMGTAAWEMSGANSYSWFGNDVTYLWDLPTGVTFGGSSVDTDETVDLEAGAGWYVVRMRGEDDSTGKRDTSSRYVFVTDGDDFRAFSEDFACRIIADTAPRVGRSITLEVKASRGTDVMSRIYKTAPVLITYEHIYSADKWATVDAAPDGLVENFYGYIRSYEQIGTTVNGVDTYQVLIESPLQYFASLPIASQTIVADAAPDDWDKVVDTLAHVGYWVYYLLRYHAGALLSLSDYYIGDLDEFFRGVLSSSASDMLGAARKAVGLCLGANIGCTSDGSIYLRRHGSYETDAWRDALPTVWTWTAADIVGDLSYNYNPLMEVSETEGAGTVSSADIPPVSVRPRAGLFAPMQGLGVGNTQGFIGASSDDIRDRVAHDHQRTNAPVKSIPFTPRGGHDFIEPALMEWHAFDLDAYDPGDMGVMNNTRLLPLQVTRNWNYTPLGIRLTQSAVFEPETKGIRAPLVPQIVIGSPIQADTPPAYPALSIVWVSTGATPSGWSGLSGTTETSPGNWYTGSTSWSSPTRASNANWSCVQPTTTGAFGVLFDLGGVYTITQLEAQFTWTNTSNTKIAKFLGYHNGAWFEIYSRTFTGLSSGGTATFTGSTVASKLIWACKHGGTNPTISMLTSKINSP